jgi:RNA polymerase sigma-70 factor (ECF subfamily)
MTAGMIEAAGASGGTWFPLPGAAPRPVSPLSAPPEAGGLSEARRRQLRLASRFPVATIRAAAPPPIPAPSQAPRPDAPAEAFARRVESHLAFLRKAARYWHRDRAQADDLVQDTIVQALANAHLWRPDQPDCNFRGWLFTIMRNRFLAGRARAKRGDTAIDAIAAPDECVPAVASRPEARLMLRDLERGLARLPDPQRQAIRLVGVEGRSYEEAARLMGLSVAALRCHLSRGRERLRELVEGNTALPLRASRARPPARPAGARPEKTSITTAQPEYAPEYA